MADGRGCDRAQRRKSARAWLLGCILASLATAVAAEPSTHTVVIENMAFNPAELDVQRGDRIEWINRDLVPHTATAADNAFDSKLIEAGASWSYSAAVSGEHAYRCTFHPTMKGTLKIR